MLALRATFTLVGELPEPLNSFQKSSYSLVFLLVFFTKCLTTFCKNREKLSKLFSINALTFFKKLAKCMILFFKIVSLKACRFSTRKRHFKNYNFGRNGKPLSIIVCLKNILTAVCKSKPISEYIISACSFKSSSIYPDDISETSSVLLDLTSFIG